MNRITAIKINFNMDINPPFRDARKILEDMFVVLLLASDDWH